MRKIKVTVKLEKYIFSLNSAVIKIIHLAHIMCLKLVINFPSPCLARGIFQNFSSMKFPKFQKMHDYIILEHIIFMMSLFSSISSDRYISNFMTWNN